MRCASGILLVAFAPCAAGAPLDTFALRIGGFVTRFDTTIRVDDPDGDPGTPVDFDRELGLEDQAVIELAGVQWRPAPRHELGLNYFRESLAGTRQLERDLRIGGETFEIDSTVRSRLGVESFEFHYSYWPIVRDDWALGLRFGVIDYRIATRIELLLGERGQPPEARVRVRVSEDVPAPTFGVDLRVQPAERWRFNVNVGWFEAKFDTVSPLVINARGGLEYRVWDNIGLWADAGFTRIDADVHGSVQGAFDINEGGVRLGVTVSY